MYALVSAASYEVYAEAVHVYRDYAKAAHRVYNESFPPSFHDTRNAFDIVNAGRVLPAFTTFEGGQTPSRSMFLNIMYGGVPRLLPPP